MTEQTENEIMELVREILTDVVYHLAVTEPQRTLTARRLINRTVLEIERAYAVVH